MGTLIFLAAAVAVVFAHVLHRRFYFLQYLFFLRYPLLLGLILFLLPVVAMDATGAPFRNLFIHERPSMIALVTVLALLVAWETMYLVGFIFEHIAERVELPFRRKPEGSEKRTGDDDPSSCNREKKDCKPSNEIPAWLRLRRYRFAIFALLALPVIAASMWYSIQGQSAGTNSLSVLGIVIGLLEGLVIAVVLIALVTVLVHFFPSSGNWLVRVTAWVDKTVFRTTTIITDPKTRKSRSRVFRVESVFWFAVITFLVYVYIIAFPPDPADNLDRFDLPAMVYVLLLMMLIGWLMPWLSYLLDRHRMVPEIVIAIVVALAYNIFDTDHYYGLHYDPESEAKACPAGDSGGAGLVASTHSRARFDWSGANNSRPVIVAASGGGITAAYWTSVVLGGIEQALTLRDAPELGFSDTVHMVSGTSGGSVGLLYYSDAFSEKADGPRRFSDRELGWIRKAAGASSLSAVGWGLVSRDFWRLFLPSRLLGDSDRATAMEARWIQGLPANQKRWQDKNGKGRVHDPTIGQWQAGVRQGWRPATAFNAVLIETGELLQIANVELPSLRTDLENTRHSERQFHELYPGADIDAVTAARLSATFPWVSPAARPDLPDDCANLYHAADGGYYDNYGVVSALAYAKALDGDNDPILVEIRASDSRSRPEPDIGGGFGVAFLGPLKALLAVRGTSQLGRNELLVEAQISEERRVVFELRQKSPLSWHLAPREKVEVESEWSRPHNRAALRKLCELLDATCTQ